MSDAGSSCLHVDSVPCREFGSGTTTRIQHVSTTHTERHVPRLLVLKGVWRPLKRFTSRAEKFCGSCAQATGSRTLSPLPQSLIGAPPHQLPTTHGRHLPSRLALAGKTAGADVWQGLKVALQSLEESDLFLPLKHAVSGQELEHMQEQWQQWGFWQHTKTRQEADDISTRVSPPRRESVSRATG